MKNRSMLSLFVFALSLISILSILYESNAREHFQSTIQTASVSAPLFMIPTDSKSLALTFDLDSGSNDVSSLLTILDSNQAKATFFVTGNWLDSHQEDLLQIVQSGHEIGNHTESHPDMTLLKEKEQSDQINSLHNSILNLTGITMRIFRPPYGAYDYSVIQTARKLDYTTINWTIDSKDWKGYEPDEIVENIMQNKNLKNGAVLLFHASELYTDQALQLLIPRLKEQGYEFFTVSELLNEKGVKPH